MAGLIGSEAARATAEGGIGGDRGPGVVPVVSSCVPRSLEPNPALSLFGTLEPSTTRFAAQPAIAGFGRRLSYRTLLPEVEADRYMAKAPGVFGRPALVVARLDSALLSVVLR